MVRLTSRGGAREANVMRPGFASTYTYNNDRAATYTGLMRKEWLESLA
jgi:hypothetical protein